MASRWVSIEMRGWACPFCSLVYVAGHAKGWLGVLALLSTACFVMGCEKPPFENRQPVEGVVTIDGQPLPKALISFSPTNGTKGPSSSGTVIDGKYRIEAESGPCPGEYQVKIETITPEIEAMAKHDMEALRRNAGKKPPAMVAAEFNVNTKLQASVREGMLNRFDFAVKSSK
jgi:hypothetical protein